MLSAKNTNFQMSRQVYSPMTTKKYFLQSFNILSYLFPLLNHCYTKITIVMILSEIKTEFEAISV